MLQNAGVVSVPGTEIWVFGSACQHDTPRDIDLLVVYDDSRISIVEACELRRALARLVAGSTSIAADILLLTPREVAQTGILQRVEATRLIVT